MAKWKSIEKKETVTEDSSEAVNRNTGRNAVALDGTPKMINWAERIRDFTFSKIEAEKMANSENKEIFDKLTDAYNKLLLVDSSSWWIDSKDIDLKTLVSFALHELSCEEDGESEAQDWSDL